jgi:hypothetical protein
VVRKSAYSKPIYLEDGLSLKIFNSSIISPANPLRLDDILSDIAAEPEDALGLDHIDKNSRANLWGRSGGPEIRIK